MKNDVATNDFMTTIYESYAKASLNEFRDVCIAAIEKLHGTKVKKDSIIRELMKLTNKDRMVTKVTNFIFAGQGLKVI